MLIFELILLVLCVVLVVPVLVLATQVIMALRAPMCRPADSSGHDAPAAVIIPAHEEEAGITATIEAILPQLGGEDRLVVVADNCSDKTADVAAKTGAEVVVREDARRGKGYALEFGVRQVLADDDRPSVMVFVDADCIMAEGSLDILVNRCAQSGRPVQARYLMRYRGGNPRRKIAEFAWIVKNWVRPLGNLRLGLPCQLTGSGMAVPVAALSTIEIAGPNIVEDMQLGLDLARSGHSPLFAPEALVESDFPEEASSAATQRTRWEHGHLGTLLSETPGLLRIALRERRADLLAMALDLAVPPLAFLALLMIGGLITTGFVYWVFPGLDLPFLIMLVGNALFAGAVFLAWFGFARHVITLWQLLSIPFYVLQKLPIYIRFLVRRQKDWVRTGRD